MKVNNFTSEQDKNEVNIKVILSLGFVCVNTKQENLSIYFDLNLNKILISIYTMIMSVSRSFTFKNNNFYYWIKAKGIH